MLNIQTVSGIRCPGLCYKASSPAQRLELNEGLWLYMASGALDRAKAPHSTISYSKYNSIYCLLSNV